MPVKTPLLAVVPAMLIAAAVLAAAWRPWVKREVARPPSAGALAIALGYFVADYFIWNNWPGLWSAEEHRRLPLVAGAAFLIALADARWRGKISRTWLVWAAGAVLIAPILWVDISRPAAYPPVLLSWLMWSGAIALLWSENAATSMRVGGARVPLVLCLAATGACLTTVQSYSGSIGLQAASVAAMMGAFVVLGWWRPDLKPIASAIPVYGALVVGILVANRQTSLYSSILTVLSAATATLGDRGPMRKLPPWAATLVCCLLTLALAAASIRYTPKGFDFSPE